jgi:hypothetical protein
MTTSDAPRYERTRKESPLATIYYEIDMLEFAFRKLGAHSGGSGPEWNLLIEGFLLHYRSALEFFSGKKHRSGDISTKHPELWAYRKLTEQEVNDIQLPARKLEHDYWKDISQFLQHCTERRHKEFKDWKLPEMFERLKPITTAFRKSFPRPKDSQAAAGKTSLEAATTQTLTIRPKLPIESPQIVVIPDRKVKLNAGHAARPRAGK